MIVVLSKKNGTSSRVIRHSLPPDEYTIHMKFERYIFFAIFMLLARTVKIKTWIQKYKLWSTYKEAKKLQNSNQVKQRKTGEAHKIKGVKISIRKSRSEWMSPHDWSHHLHIFWLNPIMAENDVSVYRSWAARYWICVTQPRRMLFWLGEMYGDLHVRGIHIFYLTKVNLNWIRSLKLILSTECICGYE